MFGYKTNEILNNGTIKISSAGITFGGLDYFYINDQSPVAFEDYEISDDGHTVTITDLDAEEGTDLSFYLIDKFFSENGTYPITFTVDPGGTEGATPPSEKTLTVVINAYTQSI